MMIWFLSVNFATPCSPTSLHTKMLWDHERCVYFWVCMHKIILIYFSLIDNVETLDILSSYWTNVYKIFVVNSWILFFFNLVSFSSLVHCWAKASPIAFHYYRCVAFSWQSNVNPSKLLGQSAFPRSPCPCLAYPYHSHRQVCFALT